MRQILHSECKYPTAFYILYLALTWIYRRISNDISAHVSEHNALSYLHEINMTYSDIQKDMAGSCARTFNETDVILDSLEGFIPMFPFFIQSVRCHWYICSDVYKRHGDRCRAALSRIAAQSSQPQESWEDIPSMDTPQAMMDMSPLTVSQNPTDGAVHAKFTVLAKDDQMIMK